MIENFSQKEWADEVILLASKLCLRKSDLAFIVGESRFYMAHVLSETIKITDSRKLTYKSLIPFLKQVLSEDGVFKKDIHEPGRHAATRRKLYATKLKSKFDTHLKLMFDKENENVAETIAK